jgi:WD40 repeat protein
VFNGNGSQLLTWSSDGTARLWDREQGNRLRTFGHDGGVLGAAFDNDASQVLTWSSDGTARLWDRDQGSLLRTFKHDRGVLGAVLSSDAAQVLTWSDDKTARLWNRKEGTSVQTFKHSEAVLGGAFSGDSSRVLTWSKDGTARLWNIGQPEPVQTFKHDHKGLYGGVDGAAFNSDDSRVLTWGDAARLWDTASGKLIGAFHQRDSYVRGAIFNRDESQLLTWGERGVDGNVVLWNAAPGEDGTLPQAQQDKPLRGFSHADLVNGAVFNRDESQLLTWSSDGTARLWDPEQGKRLRTFKHDRAVLGARFSNDGSRVLTWAADGTARLWGTEREETLRTFQHERAIAFNGHMLDCLVTGAVLSDDESYLVTWSNDRTARLWKIPVLNAHSTEAIMSELAAIQLELEVHTAATITESGVYRLLESAEWIKLREELSAESTTDEK